MGALTVRPVVQSPRRSARVLAWFLCIAYGSAAFADYPVALSWQDNSPSSGNPVSEDGFKVQRAVGGASGQWFTIATTVRDAVSFQDVVTLPATVYAYRVVSFVGSRDSTASNVATITTPPAVDERPPAAAGPLVVAITFPPRLVNLSTRAPVLVGDSIAIGGFVIADAPGLVLIRAAGPGLAQFGVPNVLANPFLQLIGGPPNDNWQDTDGAAIAAAGATPGVNAFPFAPGSLDAALLVTLAPGAYTVHASGVAGTTGNCLIEVYLIPSP